MQHRNWRIFFFNYVYELNIKSLHGHWNEKKFNESQNGNMNTFFLDLNSNNEKDPTH